MNEYKVTGTYRVWSRSGVSKILHMCRAVTAESFVDALCLADEDLPEGAVWADDNPIVTETLESLERRTLAEWNAGKPTANPLALAHARGEL
jgi:hypothetical protein